ncbi:MAG TPA: YggS family pyridoxal phosphate-dependent enzyme [Ruminococcus sp.]|nr:YggS family pyridoxal phosphate-dependent enzyme [Ruminococcus sp.]HCR74720.1 YggS family pyridoxal phosphate-dependent enzyme [Ruminococcus sp.]
MNPAFGYIDENLKRIFHNVGEAKAKYRSPDDNIRIMAVTKTVAPEKVNYALSKGLDLIGENRVQEYLSKKDFYDDAEIHFIGHLQTNKVKYIADSVSVIQSVDSLKLASEINRCAKKIGKVQDILIEVNIGGEESKSGIPADKAEELILQVSELDNINVRGMMTIPPALDSEEFLYKMQCLYIDICSKKIDNINMDILSMGMSGDYAPAVKYGSNILRIGRAIFGERI